LHIIDVLPGESEDSAVSSAGKILNELKRYDQALFEKPRWLVLNKVDLLNDEQRDGLVDEILKGLDWQGPVYCISAIQSAGVENLCLDVMKFLENDESL
ncbi:MAG: GTPase ObgE, partial [Pseudomonadota bacterium]